MSSNKFNQLRKHFEETHHFTDEEFNLFTSFLTPVSIKKKEFFTRQNEYCRYVGYVNSGCLRAYSTKPNGDDFTIYNRRDAPTSYSCANPGFIKI